MNRSGRIIASVAILAVFSQGAAAAKATLHLMTPLWNTNLKAWMEKTLIPEFEATHPDYTVELQLTSWGAYTNNLTVAFAGGSAPDLFLVAAEQVPLVAANQMALPLDPYVMRWGQQKDYIPSVWQSDTWRGQVYAMPLTVFVPALLTRTDQVRAAGLDPASAPATWDQLETWAKRLTRVQSNKLVQVGWGPPTSAQRFMDFVVQNGGAPLSADGSEVLIDRPKAVETLQWWLNLWQDLTQGLTPPGGVGYIGAFASGTSPMVFTEPTNLGSYFQKGSLDPEDVKISPPPGRVKRATAVHVARLAISTQSKHPDAAWDFLSLLQEPKNLLAFDQALSRIPPRLSLLQSDTVRSDPIAYQDGQIATQYGWPYVAVNANWIEMQGDLTQALKDAIAGKSTPQEALSKVAQLWNNRLAK